MMGDDEIVEKVKDAIGQHGGYGDLTAAAKSAYTAARPLIERELLRDIRQWKPTEYGVYGWQDSGLVAFAKSRNITLGE